jgi:hypothetical protein
VAAPKERSEVESPTGVIIVKGVAPEPGTKLTSKRISRNLRSLNRSRYGKKKGHSASLYAEGDKPRERRLW